MFSSVLLNILPCHHIEDGKVYVVLVFFYVKQLASFLDKLWLKLWTLARMQLFWHWVHVSYGHFINLMVSYCWYFLIGDWNGFMWSNLQPWHINFSGHSLTMDQVSWQPWFVYCTKWDSPGVHQGLANRAFLACWTPILSVVSVVRPVESLHG